MNTSPQRLKHLLQFLLLSTAITVMQGCNISISKVDPAEETASPLPETTPAPEPAPEIELAPQPELTPVPSADALVMLNIAEPAGIIRDNEIVRTGVPFPQGLIQANAAIQLTHAGSNTPLPVQVRPLSLWADGSVRWLLVDTQLNLEATENKSIELKYAANEVINDNPLTISENNDFINIDTGPLQFSVPKNNGSIIHSATLTQGIESLTLIAAPSGDSNDRGPWVSVDGQTHFAGLLTSDSVPAANDSIKKYESYVANDWGEDFNLHGLWDLSVSIEEQGDLHAVIRISGTHLNESGQAYSSFITRVHAYRGQSQLKIDHTLVFTGSGNDKISDYGFRLPYAGNNTLIEGITAHTGEVTHLAYEHYNRPGASNITGQAHGYIARENNQSNISVVLKDMAENFPKGLAATDKGIDIQLYPPSAPALALERYSTSIDSTNGETASILSNRNAQGLSKTDTFVIDFAAGAMNKNTSEALAQKINAGPLLALADGDWYSDAKVMGIGDFTFTTDVDISQSHFRIDRKLKVIEDFMRFNQRKQFNWFGMLNYGDIRGAFDGGCAQDSSACTWSEKGRYGWSGNSGEPSNQLWVQFLRSPSRALFTDASALAQHSQDLQMIHYGDASTHNDQSISGGRNREFAVGSFHRHGVDAWSGYGQRPDYSHVAGIETYYYLTGNGRAKEALFEAAAFMTRYSQNTPSHTALVNGIDVLSRAAAVFYDQPAVFNRFNNRLEVLIDDTYSQDGVSAELANNSLAGAFSYFVRGAAGLMYHHERTGDNRSANMILDAADIITQGGDKWGVANSGSAGSVWYYLNNLTYAHSIADQYSRNKTPYYNLVSQVLGHNDHSNPQSGSDVISLASFAAVPNDWTQWVWEWDAAELDPSAPALLHITRQMTFRNDFMQDYHSYRAFVHLATAAALVTP